MFNCSAGELCHGDTVFSGFIRHGKPVHGFIVFNKKIHSCFRQKQFYRQINQLFVLHSYHNPFTSAQNCEYLKNQDVHGAQNVRQPYTPDRVKTQPAWNREQLIRL